MFCFKQISFIFKTFSFFILFSISFFGTVVHSADVTLAWERPNDFRVTGYKIFYGLKKPDSTSVPEEIINNNWQTSCDIYDLRPGKTYYFAAKSFDRHNNESVFSEVIFYDVPEIQDKNSSGNRGSNYNVDDDNEENIDGNSSNANNNDDDGSSGGGGCFFQTISNINKWNF